MAAKIRFHSLFALAAMTILCASASAQWPQRWLTTGTADDEAQVVAVGRSGAAYVAGKTKTWGGIDGRKNGARGLRAGSIL